MCKKIKYLALIIFTFVFTASVYAAVDLEFVKQKLKEAVVKDNYYAEYSDTVFRFGRRSEVSFKTWVMDDTVIKQIVGPSWQWGETIVQTPNEYYYYIPAQNGCFRINRKISKSKNRLGEWENWIRKINKFEETSISPSHSFQTVSGTDAKENFKLIFNNNTFFPSALLIRRNGVLIREIRFQKIEELPRNFKLEQLLPNGDLRWFNDEEQFWQAVSLPRVRKGVNFPIIEPTYLPQGYVFKKALLEELPSATVVHLVYDGPNKQVLSIFEREKLSDKQMYTLNSFKDKKGEEIISYQWFEKQVHLAIFGSVSKNDLKKIVHSMK